MGADGRTVYYTSERDGNYNIYKATIAREDDPNFSNATVVKEEPVFPKDKLDRTCPMVSPDGKKLAYILDRNKTDGPRPQDRLGEAAHRRFN